MAAFVCVVRYKISPHKDEGSMQVKNIAPRYDYGSWRVRQRRGQQKIVLLSIWGSSTVERVITLPLA